MTFLVDTSLAVGISATGVDEPVAVSVITVGELEVGVSTAADAPARAKRLARLTAILENATVLPVDQAVASRYAALRTASGRQPTNDLWIAATAAAYDLVLVTGDERQAKLPGISATYVRVTGN